MGRLSNAIRWLDINSQYASRAGLLLARYSTKDSTLIRSFSYDTRTLVDIPVKVLNPYHQDLRSPRVCATNLTKSSEMSTGIKIGVSSYALNVEIWFSFSGEYFPTSKSAMVSYVRPILSVTCSAGRKAPSYLRISNITNVFTQFLA